MVDIKTFDDDPHEWLRLLYHDVCAQKPTNLEEFSELSDAPVPKSSAMWYPGTTYRLTIYEEDGRRATYTSKGVKGRLKVTPASDMVNQPPHYNQGDVECIDAMVSAFGMERVATFCHINAFKYLFRSFDKENAERDREKAIWFLRFANGDDPRRDNDDEDAPPGLCNPCPAPVADGVDVGLPDDDVYHLSPRRGANSLRDDEC